MNVKDITNEFNEQQVETAKRNFKQTVMDILCRISACNKDIESYNLRIVQKKKDIVTYQEELKALEYKEPLAVIIE
jgi:peptidoglycan hydrolase CwlO-like protein